MSYLEKSTGLRKIISSQVMRDLTWLREPPGRCPEEDAWHSDPGDKGRQHKIDNKDVEIDT